MGIEKFHLRTQPHLKKWRNKPLKHARQPPRAIAEKNPAHLFGIGPENGDA